MTTKLDDISEAIGFVRAEVLGLRRDVHASEVRAQEFVRRADEQRAILHKRMDDLVDEFGDLKSKVGAVEVTVRDTKEVTDEVRAWKQRGIGALAVAGMAGAAISGTAVAFIAYWWEAILKILRAG